MGSSGCCFCRRCCCVIFLAFLLSSSAASAFNITRILEHNAGFGTFNSYLTQTELADEINRRETITVLAVDDAAAAALSGQPLDVVRKVLSVHVILDYYDVPKLQHLHKKTALVTTLFQSTGLAIGQMGFLNVSVSAAGVTLGSAVAGAGPRPARETRGGAAIQHLRVAGQQRHLPPSIQNTNYTAIPPPPPPPPAAATPKPAPAPESSPPPASSPAATAPSPANAVDDDASPPAPETPDAAPAASPTTAAADDDNDDQGAAPGPADASPAARVTLGAGGVAVVGLPSCRCCLLSELMPPQGRGVSNGLSCVDRAVFVR
ncbi:unnamed protein product [Spirodela intermedia]|uniref:FAS1 domain-containing protein n=1 Tax=Spirodela intermedia TaxID=51605 RepID=A0A7I8JMP7_SPIIN|nr:unnamed protein product [Spirodela intermedia]CAA6671081.1 unnamed protein product [Spirodela intermedia]